MNSAEYKRKYLLARQQLDKLALFIRGAADFFKGIHPELDEDFIQIKRALRSPPDYDKASEIAALINPKFIEQGKLIEHARNNTIRSIENTLQHLLNEKILEHEYKELLLDHKNKIQSFSSKQPDSLIQELAQVVHIMRHLLDDALSKQTHQIDEALTESIVFELKKLIEPFLNTPSNQKSGVIELNSKLERGLHTSELLECCLVFIRYVLKDASTKTEAAGELIFKMHQSLSSINDGLKNQLSRSKKQLDSQEQKSIDVRKQIKAIAKSLSNANELENLKAKTNEHLTALQTSLSEHEESDKVALTSLISLLHKMQRRIAELEHESASFQNKLLAQQIQAQTDSLTKLPNRQAYESKIKQLKVNQSLNEMFLAIIDIDFFKKINDTFGHSVGDKTLQIVAQHLKKQLPKEDFLSRWGGEEFVTILHATDLQNCFEKLEKVRASIEKLPFMFSGEKVSITVSVGIASFSDQNSMDELGGIDVNSVFEVADKHLYQAKQNGRNKVCK